MLTVVVDTTTNLNGILSKYYAGGIICREIPAEAGNHQKCLALFRFHRYVNGNEKYASEGEMVGRW